MRMRRLIVVAAFSLGLGLLATSQDAQAVHKNYDNMLTCGNCHTMHNSQGSTATGDGNGGLGGNAGGSLILLRGAVSNRSQIHKFCLQCHASNGAQQSVTFGADSHPAPKVLINGQLGAGNSAVAGTLDSFAVIGAGGDFSRELNATWDATTAVALGYGHSLGAQTVIPPGGDASIADFSCTNCHDPHGAYNAPTATVNEYRNLRISATGASTNAGVTLNVGVRSYVGDQSSAVAGGGAPKFIPSGTGGNVAANRRVWPVYDNDAALVGTSADAVRSNTYPTTAGFASGTDGISRWCAQCHDNWHEALVGGNRDANTVDWRRHPVDNSLGEAGSLLSGAGVTIIDTANYGAQIATYKALPIADTNGTASGVAYLPSGQEANSKVFCLSCHFAHGGPYFDLLRWDYLSAVGPAGSQEGNSIASTVGCQLCHNR